MSSRTIYFNTKMINNLIIKIERIKYKVWHFDPGRTNIFSLLHPIQNCQFSSIFNGFPFMIKKHNLPFIWTRPIQWFEGLQEKLNGIDLNPNAFEAIFFQRWIKVLKSDINIPSNFVSNICNFLISWIENFLRVETVVQINY
jgi:hypothetical protein